MFTTTIAKVSENLRADGLGSLLKDLRFGHTTGESFYNEAEWLIRLNPADARYAPMAYQTRMHLVLHELGHHFCNTRSRKDKKRLSVFNDLDAHYRRGKMPRYVDVHHVSRYAMTHPLEDFAETFAVYLHLWWDGGAENDALVDLYRGYWVLGRTSGMLAAKVRVVGSLLREARLRNRRRQVL